MPARSVDPMLSDSTLSAISRAVAIVHFGPLGSRIAFANPVFTSLTGYCSGESFGPSRRFLEGPDSDPDVVAQINKAIAAGRSIRREVLSYRKTGEHFWNDLSIDPLRNPAGALIGFIGVCVDARGERGAGAEMTRELKRFEDITRHIPGYIYRCVLKPDGTMERPYLSRSLNHLLEIPEGVAITARAFLDHVHADDRDTFTNGVRESAAGLSAFRREFRLVSSRGTVRWVRCDASPRLSPNGDMVWDGVAVDITAEKTAAREIAFLTLHDSLTGLSNRARLKNAVSRAIEAIEQDEAIGLFSIDTHRLQDINDALGHAAGDEVLRLVGQKLQSLAESRAGLAARMSSDEFAVLLPRAAGPETLHEFGEAVFEALGARLHVGGEDLVIQTCIGAVLFPSKDDRTRHMVADTPAELMKRADIALRAAKSEGPNTYRLYAAHTDDRLRNRLTLRHSLRRGLDEGQFALHYQPLVDLKSGSIAGAEALVRWNHPALGMQRPDQFIPLAEESGLIAPIGAWVISEAMTCRRNWIRAGLKAPVVAINVSGLQLKRPDFMDTVERSLAMTGADPRGFELELTEGVMIDTSEDTRRLLQRLRSMGFCITIDDFGAGHSTFKYLKEFPVDKIKIDQVFVRGLTVDSNDASIVRAMIGLARNLSLGIVAEGVETSFHRRFLKAEGCGFGQGYLFSPPLAEDQFTRLIAGEAKLPRPKVSPTLETGISKHGAPTRSSPRASRARALASRTGS